MNAESASGTAAPILHCEGHNLACTKVCSKQSFSGGPQQVICLVAGRDYRPLLMHSLGRRKAYSQMGASKSLIAGKRPPGWSGSADANLQWSTQIWWVAAMAPIHGRICGGGNG
jgi:hypothetical protein